MGRTQNPDEIAGLPALSGGTSSADWNSGSVSSLKREQKMVHPGVPGVSPKGAREKGLPR